MNIKIIEIDPRTKVIFFGFFTAACSLSKSLFFTLALLAIILTICFFSDIRWKLTKPFWHWLVVIVMINLFSLALNVQGSSNLAYSCTLLELSILSTLRLLVLFLSSIWLCFCFDHKKWDLVCHGFGFPDKVALIASLIPRYITVLLYDFISTKEAQQARGLEADRKRTNIFHHLSIMCSLLIPTFVRAWSEVEDKINSLDMRGINLLKKRSWCNTLKFTYADCFALTLIVAAFVVSMSFVSTQTLGCY